MVFKRPSTSASCPNCLGSVQMSFAVFRGDFQCQRCGTALRVTTQYGRILGLISAVLGLAVGVALVVVTTPRPLYCSLIPALKLGISLPMAFLFLVLLMHIGPHLVRPSLIVRVRRHAGSIAP